jgi:hypothetical protein
MPFYRVGNPGEDSIAHFKLGGKTRPQRCAMPKFPEDDRRPGATCGRMSVALCDGPGCDKAICELHRTKHPVKSDTDYCPDHKRLAYVEQ